jgi:hypothetical protein
VRPDRFAAFFSVWATHSAAPPSPPKTEARFQDQGHYQNEPFFQTEASLNALRSVDDWKKQGGFEVASQSEQSAIDQTPGSASTHPKRDRESSAEPALESPNKRARMDSRYPPSLSKGRGNG